MINVNIENFDLLSPKLERENIQLGLSRIKNALRDLDDPCKNIPAIQIVGTNGKGSITAFIENILYADKKNIPLQMHFVNLAIRGKSSHLVQCSVFQTLGADRIVQ